MQFEDPDAPAISQAPSPSACISALMDGGLPSADVELALAHLNDPQGGQTWNIYHRIGDAIKSSATPDLSAAFAEKLNAGLITEPTKPLIANRTVLLVRYGDFITTLQLGIDADQAAHDLLAVLEALSLQLADKEMVRLTVMARDVLAVAKGKGQMAGTQYRDVMLLCARHWKRLHPTVGSTGLATREQAVIARRQGATTPVALRAASEDAGTVAWLYEISALLGEDVTRHVAHHPVTVPGTHYHACYTGIVLRYLQCGASYNVNQFVRLALPGAATPPLIIVGEAKGGAGGYGMVRGPRAFMLAQGMASGIISQRDKLYPLTRARYMAMANEAFPAGKERKLAGKAIEQAGRDGMLVYLVVRGKIDLDKLSVSSEIEEFAC